MNKRDDGDHRADAGDCHQAPAHIIVPDDGQQAAMQDAEPQGGGRDVFVHISAVERAGLSTLNEGQRIEYEIEENRGKTSAVNLKVK
jgi:cold shock protein